MEQKSYNKTTRFILPFIIPDKTLLCDDFGFINAYTKTILKKTTVIIMFKYDLRNHYTLHEVLEALDNFKVSYQNETYELFEFSIPENDYYTVTSILTNNVYGLPSVEKSKIMNFWKDFSLNHLSELLKDLIELDILSIHGINDSIYNEKGID